MLISTFMLWYNFFISFWRVFFEDYEISKTLLGFSQCGKQLGEKKSDRFLISCYSAQPLTPRYTKVLTSSS